MSPSGNDNDIDTDSEVSPQWLRELADRMNTMDTGAQYNAAQSGAWITEESPELNAINDPILWVDREHVSKPIKDLDAIHIKRILDGFNMGANYHGQHHKIDALVEQYKKLQDDK